MHWSSTALASIFIIMSNNLVIILNVLVLTYNAFKASMDPLKKSVLLSRTVEFRERKFFNIYYINLMNNICKIFLMNWALAWV